MTIKKKTLSFDEALVNHLKDDPELAQIFLKDAFEEYDQDQDVKALMYSIGAYAKAKGVTFIAKEADLGRENLYKLFNGETVPRLDTLGNLLRSIGFKISITPLEQIHKK